jgi:hypothetical protein
VDFGSRIDALDGIAQRTGRSTQNLMNSLSGTDLGQTKDALADVTAELERMKSNPTEAWVWQTGPLEDYKRELEGVVTQYENAGKLNTPEAMNAKRVDDLAAAFSNAGIAAESYFETAEDGAQTFNAEKYIADWESQIAKADEVKADLFSLPASIRAEAERQWAEGGVGAADAYVDAYQAADPSVKARLESIAGPQGQAAGQAAARGFVAKANEGVNTWVPPKMTVSIGVDDREVRNWTPPMKKALVSYTAVAADKKGLTWQ